MAETIELERGGQVTTSTPAAGLAGLTIHGRRPGPEPSWLTAAVVLDRGELATLARHLVVRLTEEQRTQLVHFICDLDDAGPAGEEGGSPTST